MTALAQHDRDVHLLSERADRGHTDRAGDRCAAHGDRDPVVPARGDRTFVSSAAARWPSAWSTRASASSCSAFRMVRSRRTSGAKREMRLSASRILASFMTVTPAVPITAGASTSTGRCTTISMLPSDSSRTSTSRAVQPRGQPACCGHASCAAPASSPALTISGTPLRTTTTTSAGMSVGRGRGARSRPPGAARQKRGRSTSS